MDAFTPTCSFPTTSVGFVQTPPIRGTMEIVWSSLSVIFLCTWSILHLKVPPQHRPKGWVQKISWKAALLWRKLKWMIVTILAPEVLLAFVSVSLWAVREITPELQKLADADGVPWSETHSWFANQGGFLMHFPPTLPSSPASSSTANPPTDTDECTIPNKEVALRTAQDLERGDDQPTPFFNERRRKYLRRRDRAISRYGPLPGNPSECFHQYVKLLVVSEEKGKKNALADDRLNRMNDIWVVDSIQMLYMRKKGIIGKLPMVEEEELQDRNKGDAIVRLIAILQVCWMGMQLVTRAARGLPVATLEIAAVAFVGSSLATYLLQWSNVKDPAVPMRLEANRLPNRDEFTSLRRKGIIESIAYGGMPNGPGLRNDVIRNRSSSVAHKRSFFAIVALGGVLFGGIHLIAWDFEFPTPLEQTLWRASALITTATPTLNVFFLGVTGSLCWIARLISPETHQKYHARQRSIAWLIAGIYVVARLYLLAECFRSLYYLPPAAYQTTWTKNAPHFG